MTQLENKKQFDEFYTQETAIIDKIDIDKIRIDRNLAHADDVANQVREELENKFDSNAIDKNAPFEVTSYSKSEENFHRWIDFTSPEFKEWTNAWLALDEHEREFSVHPAWIASWLQNFSTTLPETFRLIVVKQANHLAAVIPAVVESTWAGSWNECILKVKDFHPLEGASLAIRSEQFENVIDAIFESKFDGRSPIGISIDKIKTDHTLFESSRLMHHEETEHRAELDLSNGYDAFMKGLGKNQRATLRKTSKKIHQLEQASIEVYDQPESILQAFSSYCKVESRSWKSDGQTDMASDHSLAAFYRSVLREMAWNGEAAVVLLRLDGQIVGGMIGMILDEKFFIQKITYDKNYAKLAPGNILLEWTAREFCLSRKLKAINLVTNLPWHERWRPSLMKNEKVTLLPSGSRGKRGWLRTYPWKDAIRKKSAGTGFIAACLRWGMRFGRKTTA